MGKQVLTRLHNALSAGSIAVRSHFWCGLKFFDLVEHGSVKEAWEIPQNTTFVTCYRQFSLRKTMNNFCQPNTTWCYVACSPTQELRFCSRCGSLCRAYELRKVETARVQTGINGHRMTSENLLGSEISETFSDALPLWSCPSCTGCVALCTLFYRSLRRWCRLRAAELSKCGDTASKDFSRIFCDERMADVDR